MREKIRSYSITLEGLAAYQESAIQNARSLLEEATLLLNAGYLARAYFLAEAAIEETGKAAIAHTAKSRNLASSGVQARLRTEFENHPAKIRAAFFGHLSKLMELDSGQRLKHLEQVFHYTEALERGRESSMYVGFRNDGTTYAPADLVKPEVARDCVLLATECLMRTTQLVNGPSPTRFSSADDKWYELGPKALKVWQESDFGEYLLDCITRRGPAFSISDAVTTYHDAYLCKGRKFKPAAGSKNPDTSAEDGIL